MRYIKFGLLVPIFLWFASCGITVQAPTPTVQPKSDSYLDKRNADDTDRDSILKKARERADGKICEGNDNCEGICDDIYSRRREQGECEELSIGQVKRLGEIYDALENPRLSELKEIDVSESGDFDLFINIDIRSLQTLVKRYKENDAEEVLEWIASYDDAATIFEKEDNDFEILNSLLDTLSSDSFDALGENIAGRDNFMDIAVVAKNEVALEWIHEYLEEEHTDCKQDNEARRAKCLRAYCGLARDMDDSNAGRLLNFDYFEDYIEEVLEDAINGDTDTDNGNEAPSGGAGWDADEGSSNYIDDIDELGNWWEDLC